MQPADSEIAERLRAILQSEEFQPRLSERFWLWVDEAQRALRLWLEHLSPGMRAIVIAACLLVLAAIAIHIWWTLREAARPNRASVDKSAAHELKLASPEMLLARARSFADKGCLRDAARALQQALLLYTCREQNLPWRSSLSDWEWVKILRPSESAINFTRTTQRIAFGPQPSRAEFDVCANQVHSLITTREDIGPEVA